MKKFFLICTVCVLSIFTVRGQVPESFKYQTIVRNSDGEILVNQPITLILDLLQGSITGTSVFNETFYVTTNEFGLINIEIGSLNPSAFHAIDWANGPYFIKVTLDGNVMGTTELLSVPYSLFAKKSGEFLPPSMAYEEIYAIPDPSNGMLVFCTDCDPDGSGALLTYEYGDWYILNSSCLGPMPPTAGIHDTLQTQITWNWNAVPGALGYKWNTSNNFSTAIDLETSTTKVETGLSCNTLYTRYVWSYSNSCHSDVTVLSQMTAPCTLVPCPDPPIVVYEGQTYNTVQIGLQCWLKENLNVGVQIDGSLDQTDNGIIEKYCYNNNASNCEIYGGLYQWEEIMHYTTNPGVQGICPEGWHIPTDAEWCELTTYIDETVNCNEIGPTGTDACLKMKSTSGWDMGGNGTDEYGFTALPAGSRFPDHFQHIGMGTDFWTSTSVSNPGAYYWVCYYANDFTGRYVLNLDWYCGVSVRCIKDN